MAANLFGYQLTFADGTRNQIETIVLMRHGEKPKGGHGQISCQGLNRALALPQVLIGKYGKPHYLFAPDPTGIKRDSRVAYNYLRPLASIEPIAIQASLPVNTGFILNDSRSLATELVAPQYHQATVFVAWEHNNLVPLARRVLQLVGADPKLVPAWSGHDYDSLYVITINWTTQKVSFTHDYQQLNHQSSVCPSRWSKRNKISIFKLVTAKHGHQIEQILFIPEGELAVGGLGQLSFQGFNRALSIPTKLMEIYNKVDMFIAPSPTINTIIEEGQSYYYLRALMTLEPSVVQYGAALYTAYGYKEVQQLATYLNSPDFFNKTVIVAWQKNEIPALIKCLYLLNGGNTNEFPSIVLDHDTMYAMKIIRKGTKITTSINRIAENLNRLSQPR